MVQVLVRFNKVDHPLRMLKMKMQREGIFRTMKMKRFHYKPSKLRVIKQEESQRRRRKINRRHG